MNSSERGSHSNICFPQEIKSQTTLDLRELEKGEQRPDLIEGRKLQMIRGETNEIETKKTIEKISETKSWFFDKITLTNL